MCDSGVDGMSRRGIDPGDALLNSGFIAAFSTVGESELPKRRRLQGAQRSARTTSNKGKDGQCKGRRARALRFIEDSDFARYRQDTRVVVSYVRALVPPTPRGRGGAC
jgi:hypothetical protein